MSLQLATAMNTDLRASLAMKMAASGMKVDINLVTNQLYNYFSLF